MNYERYRNFTRLRHPRGWRKSEALATMKSQAAA